MKTYRILFLGDVVGRSGRDAVKAFLPGLLDDYKPLFVIINGENSAAGTGITPDIVEEFLAAGADAITLGNHWFHKRDIEPVLVKGDKPLVRPANVPPGIFGRGMVRVTKEGISLAVMNLCGRTFMDAYDDPFRCVDALLAEAGTPHIFIDFHAEATSEKIAFGWHVDGRASVVVGTHTHVQTADERILPGGTAYLTDAGMCGPMNSVLGMETDVILKRFRTGLPQRFEVARGPSVISGVVVDVERMTGRGTQISRIRLTE